ncbi:MAG: dihydrolipoyl dehydrogenase [Candidatus Omnitrophica bacterium]|nr:dihydrolipoyl dehydrogenase [Candidatus Omnitrophota bacterium]
MNQTSLVIIGAGPGGYTAALLAARAGIKVTLIDQKVNPGGVCLFSGCIPSKTLLHMTRLIQEAKKAQSCGISFNQPRLDIKKIRQTKNDIIAKLTQGLGFLCKKSNIDFIQGKAAFKNSHQIEIQSMDGSSLSLSFKKAIIATGSEPIDLPFAPNSPHILNSLKAINLNNIPESMLVIGGGYIGLELGSVYAGFGSQVTIVEMQPRLLVNADRDLVRILERSLKKSLHQIKTQTKVVNLQKQDNGIQVTIADKRGKQEQHFYEKVLISIGRRPNIQTIRMEQTPIKPCLNGFIPVNETYQTIESHIYAIGDVIGPPILAHKASYEARQVVHHLLGQQGDTRKPCIPGVVFTDPEIAWCGLTEQDAQQQNIDIKISRFPWAASGRAITLHRPDGLTKIIADPASDKILGLGIVGYDAGELIGQGVLAIQMGATVKDVMNAVQQHPTLSETILEAAEHYYGVSPHIFPK